MVKPRWLNTQTYEYIARVDWLEGNKLAVQCQNREQTCLDLLNFLGPGYAAS
ncbi:MAG: hypothetical protein CM1200mP3_18870 [Chloroflexota bacterium]|nr:MAG: hypothetical protein CM1200mP3_18870 [Chloroflexota bacterium]